MKLLRVTPAEVRAMIRKAFAAGKAAGEEHVLHGLKTVARLNGSGAAVLGVVKAESHYDPNETRDESGKWTAGGGGKDKEKKRPVRPPGAAGKTVLPISALSFPGGLLDSVAPLKDNRRKPIVVSRLEDGKYHIHDGVGRASGMRNAGQESVHAIVVTPEDIAARGARQGDDPEWVSLMHHKYAPSSLMAKSPEEWAEEREEAARRERAKYAAVDALDGFDLSRKLHHEGVAVAPADQSRLWKDDPETLAKYRAALKTRYAEKDAARVAKAAPPDFAGHPHRLLALAMVETARRGADADALHHLADLANDPALFHESAAGGAVAKAFRKAWAAHLHPRGKDGRFISKGEINAAKSDPAKAEELRAKVRPQDAGKLEDAISGETDLRNSREVARDAGHAFRRDRAERVKAVKRATGRVLNNEADIEDFAALAHHLPYLTKDELRDARVKMNARFGAGKSPRRDAMVKALVGYALDRGEGKTHEEATGRGKPEVSKDTRTTADDDSLQDSPGTELKPTPATRHDELEADTRRRLEAASKPLAGNRYSNFSDADLGAAHRNHVTNLAAFRRQLRESGPGSSAGDAAAEIAKREPRLAEADAELKRRIEVARLNRRLEAIGESRKSGKLTVSEAEMRGLLSGQRDAYREAGIGRSEGGRYPYTPEAFKTSDLTGARVRHYVELPDGRIAHPDELTLAQKRGRLSVVPDAEKPGDFATASVADRLANPATPRDTRTTAERLDADTSPADQLHAAGVPADRARAPADPPDDDHAKERYDAARDKLGRMQAWAQDKPESLAAAGASAAAGKRLGRAKFTAPDGSTATASEIGKRYADEVRAAVATDAGAEPAGGLRKEAGQGGGPAKPAAGVSGDTPGTKPVAPPAPGPLTPAALASAQTAEKIAAVKDAYRTDDLHPDMLALGAKHGVNQPAALRQLQREAAAGGIDPAAVLAEAVGTLTGRTYPSGGGRRNYAPDDLAPYDVQKVAERHRAANKSSA